MPSKPLVIIGSGALGHIITDAAVLSDVEVSGYLDDTIESGSTVNRLPILGNIDNFNLYLDTHSFIIGIGDPYHRKLVYDKLMFRGASLKTVIHPMSTISSSCTIGRGVFVNAFSSIFSRAVIDNNTIIDNHSSIGFECCVKSHSLIAPGVHLGSRVSVSSEVFIGLSSTVIPGCTLNEGVYVGANSTVITDIPSGTVVVGSPARKLIK